MHPLAGQGVNLGFGDVSKLSEVITKAAYNGSDLGNINLSLFIMHAWHLHQWINNPVSQEICAVKW